MKYIAVLDTDDYKDFKFYEDANGEYLMARDAKAKPYEWIALHFIKAESEEEADNAQSSN